MSNRSTNEATAPTRTSARLNQLDALSAQLQHEVDKVDGPATTTRTRARSIPRPRGTTLTRTERPTSALSHNSSDDNSRKPLRPASANVDTKPKQTTTVSVTEIENDFARGMILDDGSQLPGKRLFRTRMVEDKDHFTRVHGTAHDQIMGSLRDLYTVLDATKQPRSSTGQLKYNKPYPRVEKWVDYATKHGIAYLLTDGSLGMILKSREEDHRASSCVVVRHAKRHTELRARGKEQQYVPQGPNIGPVEFYEQVNPKEPCRRLDVPASTFRLDIEAHPTQSAAGNAHLSTLKGADAQRFKEVGLLDKFGKYMHKQMGSTESSATQPDEEAVGHVIHFYQRLGNVGAWRFADGGVQFNFPDHTKLVIYQGQSELDDAEMLVDLIYLEPRDAKDMQEYGQITHEALERRDLKTFRLCKIHRLTGLKRSEAEIIKTNQIQEKLNWIRGVVGCWIREGGLGWTGDERLGWSGLQERREDKKLKLQWVTVGRPGGDSEVERNP